MTDLTHLDYVPWKAQFDADFDDPTNYVVKTSNGDLVIWEVTPKTAHVISAAPDMLSAAIPALAIIEVFETTFGVTLKEGDLLRAAIAKATGELA